MFEPLRITLKQLNKIYLPTIIFAIYLDKNNYLYTCIMCKKHMTEEIMGWITFQRAILNERTSESQSM